MRSWGGKRKQRKILNGLLKLSKRRYVSSMTLALIYIGLGRIDEAIRCVERAYQVMEGPLVFINVTQHTIPSETIRAVRR
jgi:hypothetical protein